LVLRSGRGVLGWLLAAFAVRPLKRLAQQTRQIDAGDVHPDVDVRGASERSKSPTPSRAMLERIWKEQEPHQGRADVGPRLLRVSAHELRTPLTAMRTNLEVLATLDLPEEQRKEVVSDVIRTQSRIEATLGALSGWRRASCRLSTTMCLSTSPNSSTAPRMTRCGCTPIWTCPWCLRRR